MRGSVFKGDRVSVWEDKAVPEMGGGDGPAMGRYFMPWKCTLKNGYNGNCYVMWFLPQFKGIRLFVCLFVLLRRGKKLWLPTKKVFLLSVVTK